MTARARVVIQKALAADHDVKVAETSRRGHATRLAQGAAATGTDVVVVLGGDGTLNEAANGLAGSATALGVLPGGSTNVFARTIGMANDPIEATGQLVSRVGVGQPAPHRAGLGQRPLLPVPRRRRLRRRRGRAGREARRAQALRRPSAVRVGRRRHVGPALRPQPAPVRGALRRRRSLIDDGYFGICLKTNPYTYLGNRPFNVAPEATLDSQLVMVTFRSLRLATLVGAAASALASGRRLRRDRLIHQRAASSTCSTITGHGPFPYQIDGDYLGEVDQLELRYEPDALELIIP